jgi:sterol-4alpha-carboxylate 3-dehydrogenase (decarboxylating)
MAPIAPQTKKPLGSVLVIGGCGFLGSHIVNLLVSSYHSKVSVLDVSTSRNRRPESDGVSYHNGDITNLPELVKIIGGIKPDVVIHTASPNLMGASKDLYYKVNVEGTKCVIEACQKTGVKGLVYTSSASVISDNENDLINADERWPVISPKHQTEYYSQTKVSFSPVKFPRFPQSDVHIPSRCLVKINSPRLKQKPSSWRQTAPQPS